MKTYYYAVSRGRMPGIYNNWAAAHKQVSRFRHADMRRFFCWEDCFKYLLTKKLTKSDLEVDCGKCSDSGVGSSGTIYYAVAAGRATGLYTHWDAVKNKVLGFKNADWRIFECRLDAQAYLKRQGLYSYPTCDVRYEVSSSNPLEDIKYSMDSLGRVKVYVDGEFIRNGINGSAAGIGVWFGRNHPLNLSAPVDGYKVSNVIAQIQAVIAACRIAIEFGILKLGIYTDSEYITKYMVEYWHTWVDNEFKNSRGKPVENAELLLELRRVSEKVDVSFYHVTDNSHIEGNVGADQLAREGVEMYTSQHIKKEKH